LAGKISEDVDCFASLNDGGTGDVDTDTRLSAASATLSLDLVNRCIGLDFTNLGFPGFCPDPPAGEYTSFDHEECIRDGSDEFVDVLLRIERPEPAAEVLTTAERSCSDDVARKSSKMWLNEVDARTTCIIGNETDPFADQIDCRGESHPLDPDTGDAGVDSDILAAHNNVLRGVANSCSTTSLDVVGFPGECYWPDGSAFSVSSLVQCMYNTHHSWLIPYIDLLSPSTTNCGDGDLNFGEQCDDGNTDFERGQLCRANCTLINMCADTDGNRVISVADALFIMRVIVGLDSCALELCDVDGSGNITATDVLLALALATGQDVEPMCPVAVALTCGNGVIDRGELCDDGDTDWQFGESCNASCQYVACGDPNDSGTITGVDAAFILDAAANLRDCAFSVCDVDGNGRLTSSDVLIALNAASGQEVELRCPAPNAF
jgi:cysteine-rich repeat protein